MDLRTAEQYVRTVLQGIYASSEAAAIARLLMEQITGKSVTQIRSEAATLLDISQEHLLQSYVERLKLQEPVQYVLQEAWFYGLKLFVDRRVLIPRPETEELVHWIREDLTGSDGGGRLLDLCTGSGCIALALKHLFPAAEVEGCDISPGSLEVANRNADMLHLPVTFFQCDVLNPSGALNGKRYDILVSNPPYISPTEQSSLAAHVLDFEPHEALFVPGTDSLLYYRRIGELSVEHLAAGGRIFFEVHEDRAAEVMDLLKALPFSGIELRKDLQGKERMLRAVKAG